jgi:hypothetical protein
VAHIGLVLPCFHQVVRVCVLVNYVKTISFIYEKNGHTPGHSVLGMSPPIHSFTAFFPRIPRSSQLLDISQSPQLIHEKPMFSHLTIFDMHSTLITSFM